jgi:hypothetical protein
MFTPEITDQRLEVFRVSKLYVHVRSSGMPAEELVMTLALYKFWIRLVLVSATFRDVQ